MSRNKLAAISGVGALAAILVLSVPIYALAQQANDTGNSTNGNNSSTGNQNLGQIQGSVKISSILDQIISQAKISLGTASDTAAKAAGGTTVSGRLGIVAGYLVYDMAVKASDGMHRVIVDAGNGSVLFVSPAKQVGGNGEHLFGGGSGGERKLMKEKNHLNGNSSATSNEQDDGSSQLQSS